jgi:hypothetical protein
VLVVVVKAKSGALASYEIKYLEDEMKQKGVFSIWST